MKKYDYIIAGSGLFGAVFAHEAVKKGKKVIAVPRLAKYGEHVDDHQIQLIGQFRNLNLIYACMDGDLQKALEVVKNTTYNEYKCNTNRIIQSLEEFIEG